jgi:hypothetical protein
MATTTARRFRDRSTPPLASGCCQVNPKSLRSIVPRTRMPTRSVPYGSTPEPSTEASIWTSWLTSFIVSSPVTR